jgi:anti-sigma B factor antagonist
MELVARSHPERGWTVVAVAGELDLSTSSDLRELLAGQLDAGAALAVDLSAVTFMDSSTLGVLVGALKRARERGKELALVGVGGAPRKVLELTGLDSVFTTVDAVAELPSV